MQKAMAAVGNVFWNCVVIVDSLVGVPNMPYVHACVGSLAPCMALSSTPHLQALHSNMQLRLAFVSSMR